MIAHIRMGKHGDVFSSLDFGLGIVGLWFVDLDGAPIASFSNRREGLQYSAIDPVQG